MCLFCRRLIQLQSLKHITDEHISAEHNARWLSSGNYPDKIRFDGSRNIGDGRIRGSAWMGMETTDDAPLRAAQPAQQPDLELWINEKSPLRLVRDIHGFMHSRHPPAIRGSHSFQQATAFGRKPRARRRDNGGGTRWAKMKNTPVHGLLSIAIRPTK